MLGSIQILNAELLLRLDHLCFSERLRAVQARHVPKESDSQKIKYFAQFGAPVAFFQKNCPRATTLERTFGDRGCQWRETVSPNEDTIKLSRSEA
ncbi:MAG TPA: hypothetical protein PK156_00185 [Polyangium sp.]|nr:hypothetical protein [Polyangium sp.]